MNKAAHLNLYWTLACLFSSDSETIAQVARYLPVPQYYFHLHNSADVEDNEGQHLPDLDAARDFATSLARFEFGEAAKREGQVVLSHRIDIEDQTGAVLATVTFGEAVRVEG